MLQPTLYAGYEHECERPPNPTALYNIQCIRSRIPASITELQVGFNELYATEINGFIRMISKNLIYSLISLFIDGIIEQGLALDNLSETTCIEMMEESNKDVCKYILSLISENKNDILKFDMDKIGRAIAHYLFRERRNNKSTSKVGHHIYFSLIHTFMA